LVSFWGCPQMPMHRFRIWMTLKPFLRNTVLTSGN